MKKATTLTSALALAIGLAAASASVAQEITLAILPVGMDTFGVALGRGFTEEAEKLGARAIVVDSEWSVEKMGNGIEDLITQGVSGVAVAPADGIAGIAWLERLNSAGIPMVAVSTAVGDATKQAPTDVYPGVFAYVNHDDVVSGTLSAEIVAPMLPKDRKVKVAIVNGSPGLPLTDMRIKGFEDGLTAAGVDFEVVANQPTNWSPENGQSVCQNTLTATPDVDVFYNLADPLAIGCSQAVKAAGSKALVITTAGGMKIGNDEILAGNFVGTTCVKPETMGRMAAQVLYEAVTNPNAEAGKYYGYELTKVTAETIADCVPEW